MPVLEGGISASLAPRYLSFHVVLRGFMFLVGIIAKGYNQLFHHVHQSLIMAISSATICLSCLRIVPINQLTCPSRFEEYSIPRHQTPI